MNLVNCYDNDKNHQIIKNNICDNFKKICEVFKSLGEYKHLIFSTGISDNMIFNIDPNIGEFTVDAFRIGMMLYLYHYPNVNFSSDLLNFDIDGTLFTFANNRFHPKLIEEIEISLVYSKEFVISFLPRINSSHWYTLCIQPVKSRIIVINPLSQTSKEEEKFLIDMSKELLKNLNLKYQIIIENAGIQTSLMSCGENSMMIALSIITNGELGYSNLIEYLSQDYLVKSILDIHEISHRRKCFCKNCFGFFDTMNDKTSVIIEEYKRCFKCNEYYGGSIGLNDINEKKCLFCENNFNLYNHEILRLEKSINKKESELSIRKELLSIIENESIENVKKGCDVSEELILTKNEVDRLKKILDDNNVTY